MSFKLDKKYLYSFLFSSFLISIPVFYFYFKKRQLNPIIRIANNHNQRLLRDSSIIGDNWNSKIKTEYQDKCVGCILALTCGDILGSAVEGENPNHINAYGIIHSFPRNRKRYTDDTEMTLALMESINKNKYLSAKDCSENYGKHYLVRPSRGYGRSAQRILKALGVKQTNHLESGKLVNEEGSWANGGAMRIAPIGLCFRNASLDVILKATKAAIMCTHIHPIGIDGALIQALLVIYCIKILKHNSDNFNWEELFTFIMESSQTDEMKQKLEFTKQCILDNMSNIEYAENLTTENHKGVHFQIRASDCVASVFFIISKYYSNPEYCIQQAITLGGDTDTIACMVGSCMGALHGSKWIPQRWFKNIENSKDHGRDTLIRQALELSKFNFISNDNVIIEEE